MDKMNTKTVDYVKESEVFWQMMSLDEKVDYYTIEYLDGNITLEQIERLLQHKPKLLKKFYKGIK